MRVLGVIPARYESSRFPGKPLAIIHGKPMIWWVYHQTLKSGDLHQVYVATDDERIYDVCRKCSINVLMTSTECKNGTERVYEVSRMIEADVYVNIQGDEPTINPFMVSQVLTAFHDKSVQVATLKREIISADDINNPLFAHIVTDKDGNAMYFSRSPIPHNRDGKGKAKHYKHVSIYAYTKAFFDNYPNFLASDLEQTEMLEQLQFLYNGIKIRVVETQYESYGVDLPEHIEIVEKIITMNEVQI